MKLSKQHQEALKSYLRSALAAGIGYTYNPSTDTFTPPPVVEDAPE